MRMTMNSATGTHPRGLRNMTIISQKKKRTIYLISKLVCMLFVDIIEKFSQLKLIFGIFACLVRMSSMANDYRRNDLG